MASLPFGGREGLMFENGYIFFYCCHFRVKKLYFVLYQLDDISHIFLIGADFANSSMNINSLMWLVSSRIKVAFTVSLVVVYLDLFNIFKVLFLFLHQKSHA